MFCGKTTSMLILLVGWEMWCHSRGVALQVQVLPLRWFLPPLSSPKRWKITHTQCFLVGFHALSLVPIASVLTKWQARIVNSISRALHWTKYKMRKHMSRRPANFTLHSHNYWHFNAVGAVLDRKKPWTEHWMKKALHMAEACEGTSTWGVCLMVSKNSSESRNLRVERTWLIVEGKSGSSVEALCDEQFFFFYALAWPQWAPLIKQ